MNTHGQISQAAIQPRAVTVAGSHRARRSHSLVRAVRGMTILALALGALAVIAVQALGHTHAGHASVRKLPANVHVVPRAHHVKPPVSTGRPWMY